MTLTPADALELAKKMRMDLTQLQGRLTDLMETLAAQPASDQPRCPTCGVPVKGPLALAEHLHNSHDGPLPQHWIRAEQLAGLATDQ